MASPRLVTPEAVVLDFETAGLGSRLPAALIDVAVQVTLLVLSFLAEGALLQGSSTSVGVVVVLLVSSAIILGYPAAWETLWRGRTPGKAALGLRVVTRDGAPIRFRHALVRSLLGLVDFWLLSGAVAVLSILFTRDNQRLGDLAAGTLVLRERTGAGRPTAVRFWVPPGYEPYASTLDVSAVGADDYAAVRSYLLRAATLPPDVRAGLAVDVATMVAGRMRHNPPPGTPPDAFLACVAAAYQHRSDPVATTPAWSPAAEVWAAAAAPPSVPPPPPPLPDGPFAPRA